MLFCYVTFVAGCLLTLAAGIVEQRSHHRNLRRIPTRILINGTRGKSSITRLCAGALRGSGLVTVAKTTGTAARFIHPDGTEAPIHRKFGIANIVEHTGIVRRAVTHRPDTFVVECMAVAPELQETTQEKFVQSTIGVISNVRMDHVDEMGPTGEDIARSLSRSMPRGGVCVTAEREHLAVLEAEARRRNCELLVVDPMTVTDDEMVGFSCITVRENVAIALGVAERLGIDRDVALRGMWSAAPDPGALRVDCYVAGERRLRFANLLAANDPESTLMNIEQLLADKMIIRPLQVVIGCRPDRLERNAQIGALVSRIEPERVMLIGHPTHSAHAAIPVQWRDKVVDLGGRRDPGELLDALLEPIDQETSVVAIGNIHGQGELLVERVETLERVSPDAASWEARSAS